MELFRELEDSEIEEFKKWARDNYKPYEPIKGIWHPVIQQECVEINAETKLNINCNELDKMGE